MKTNLGKIVFLIIVVCLPLVINAQVYLKAPDTFYKNDVINFSIVATGTDINIPNIKTIDGNRVESTGTSRHTTIINGVRSYQFEKAFAFVGTKTITMPSFEVVIDNKVEKTKAKTIKMLKVEKTKSDLYDLTISVDKNEVYVGEAIEFTLKFKYKKDLNIVSLDYKKPDFESFWVKELKPQQTQNNYTQYVEQEIKYLLFPQTAGAIVLEPLKIGVSTISQNQNRGFYLTSPTVTTAVYSNKLDLNVKPLPVGINLIGDFTIKSTVDKQIVNEGESVSYKLYIQGRGNIDDLDEVKLDIPQSTIYDNPSKKEYNIKNNLYGGTYSKIYSVVAKESFTIPSIEIHYFDKKTSKIKTIKTKSYDIKVNTTQKVEKKLQVSDIQEQIVEQKTETQEFIQASSEEKVVYFICGLICGLLLVFLYNMFKYKPRKTEETPLLKTVKQAKTPNELFKILVVYINIDEELDKIIYKLEKLSIEEYKHEKKNILKILNELIKKDIKLDTQL